jgi:nucleotide-binding universal stress UspA family protein
VSGARANGPVLLCYDGSPSSATAIAVAGRLLAAREALVCHTWVGLSTAMLHTNPFDLPQGLREPAEEVDEADREAAERVAAEGAQRARAAGFNAQPLSVREERKTWRALLAEADRHQVLALVVGAHGLSGIGRALLGSVSTALVHHSERPVLVVPATAMDQGHDGPLLLCYDGSDPAKQAIETAGRLCAGRHAVVLHFWQSRVAEAPGLAGISKSVQGMAAELDEIAAEQSAERAATGVELAKRAGFEAEGLSERATGPAWMAVLDAAAQHACAGVVVGSRGLTGVSAALGSISNGVVHHSRRPVLVVPPRPGETS